MGSNMKKQLFLGLLICSGINAWGMNAPQTATRFFRGGLMCSLSAFLGYAYCEYQNNKPTLIARGNYNQAPEDTAEVIFTPNGQLILLPESDQYGDAFAQNERRACEQLQYWIKHPKAIEENYTDISKLFAQVCEQDRVSVRNNFFKNLEDYKITPE
jgi:hypothetical protein